MTTAQPVAKIKSPLEIGPYGPILHDSREIFRGFDFIGDKSSGAARMPPPKGAMGI